MFEGSFLWNCFFSSGAFDEGLHSGGLVNGFLEAPDRYDHFLSPLSFMTCKFKLSLEISIEFALNGIT